MKSILQNLRGVSRQMSSRLKQSVKKVVHILSAASLVAALFFPLAQSVQAASSYTATEVVRSHKTIKMKPGAEMTFEIHFKNTGTATWKNSGSNFVAIATVDPEKRESAFKHLFWPDVHYRPAYLKQTSVAPGQTGIFQFAIKAPDAEGEYNEVFQAVAKNAAWIDGTKFTIPITVTLNPEGVKKPVSQTQESVNTVSIEQDYPVRDAGYKAEWIGGDQLTIEGKPGEQVLTTLKAKNVGTTTWKQSGAAYTSIYTVRPNYHESQVYINGPGWITSSQIRMTSTSVKPGEVGEFKVMFQLPKQADITESFRLAGENYTWFAQGELRITFDIQGSSKTGTLAPVPQESNSTTDQVTTVNGTPIKDTSYAAQFLISSGSSLSMKSGEKTSFSIAFKNTGTKTWKASGTNFVSLYTVDPNYRVSHFATVKSAGLNNGWISNHQIRMKQSEVKPGQLGFFEFDLTAPTTAGSYTEKFRLAAEDTTWIQGGEFSLPITVKRTGSLPVVQQPSSGQTGNLGPEMRVGLFAADTPFNVTADSPFEVRLGSSGQLLASLPARTEVQVTYSKSSGMYTVNTATLNQAYNDFITLQAVDNTTIMEILSYERRLPWNPAVNENLFRGSIEIRHSQATGETWAINILPMEQYLKGIAETSSNSSVEFLKVMTLAARTYGMYHYERQTKHANKHFYVDSTYDQVYRGYALEKRHPSLVEAVDQTTGEVVTWTNPQTGETKIAITPYFSSSDGRTRSWSEVWGGRC